MGDRARPLQIDGLYVAVHPDPSAIPFSLSIDGIFHIIFTKIQLVPCSRRNRGFVRRICTDLASWHQVECRGESPYTDRCCE